MSDPNAPTTPVTKDVRRWKTEADDARHKALERIQGTADAWGKSIGTILGAFALVAFLKGPEALKDVPTTMAIGTGFTFDPARTVIVLVFAAALAVAIAMLLAAIAAQGMPGWDRILDAPTYQRNTQSAAKTAITLLNWSRGIALVGFILFFLALSLAWIGAIHKLESAAPQTQSAIVSTEAATMCGVLRTKPDGSLEVAPSSGPASAVGVAAVLTLVEDCP